jgi:flagellar biosynthesis protein FlhG
MKSLKSQNFYDVLGVAPSATPDEIRTAYEISKHTFQENSLATYSLFTDQENVEIMALISRAYETLFNPERRRAYDSQLGRSEPEPKARFERRPQPVAVPAPRQPREAPAPARMTAGTAPQPAASPAAARAPHPETPPARPPAAVARREPNPQVEEFLRNLPVVDGPSLRKLRQLHGISLEDLSDKTKIRRTYLEYLEEEQFQFLPAPVYVKGFISIIAGILGVPVQRAADEYMSRYQAARE